MNFKITTQEEKNETLMWISDLYKDVHGIRPRGYNFQEWSFDELTEFVNDLSDQAEADRKYEENMAKNAEIEFNNRIQEVIDLGAGNRETALRWMLQGDQGDEELDLYAVEYFTMQRGIDTTETGRKIEKELITNRIQQLAGGISILRIGAATESELIERYDRVDDALNATKAAIQEGILPGGGVALARAALKLNKLYSKETNPDIAAGIKIIIKSCSEPFKQIARNSGKSPEVLLNSILNEKSNIGYDFRKDTLGDMYELGVVDPKKVARCAIENAASASSMLLSAGSSMIEISKN